MIQTITTPDLASALHKLGDLAERDRRLVVFCGDRYTLLAEQTICRRLGGTMDIEVLTFARYLRGIVSRRMLSKQGSVMAVRRLLSEYRGQLLCFSGEHVSANAAAGVYDTIIRLASSKITPQMLEQADCGENTVLRQKLSDLAFLQEKYELFLADRNYMDESSYFRLLPQAIRESGALRGKHVVLFGFPSFAAQMRDGVAACIEAADSVTAFFFGGPEEIYRNEAEAEFLSVAEGREVKRFRFALPACEDAAHLRRGLYRPESFSEPKRKTDSVFLYEAEDRMDELETIAATISKRVRAGLRYRDIALLVPDPAEYALSLKRVFGEYRIPYFLDDKKTMADHPLARFVSDCLELAADGYDPDTVQSLVSNACFGGNDVYRNYLAKYAAYRGGAKKEIKEAARADGYDPAQLAYCREKLLSFALPARAEGQRYIAAIRAFLGRRELLRNAERLADRCEDSAMRSFLHQGKEKLLRVLDEAEALTDSYYLDAREMREILQNGFSACEVSMIPLKNDAVFVGNTTESKFLPVKVLFSAGLTGDVPHAAEDTALLGDKELALLGELRLRIEPTVAESNLRAIESASLNLCSFTDALYCSAPQDGEAGKSELYAYVSALFTHTGAAGLADLGEASPRPDVADYCATEELAMKRFLLAKLECEGGGASSRLAASLGALYRALALRGEQARADRLYAGQERKRYVRSGDKLFFSGYGSVSPTLLESYFDCPYRNFLSHGLKLSERDEGSMRNTDPGNFVHAVLEQLSECIRSGEVDSDESCKVTARRLAAAQAEQPPYCFRRDTAEGAYHIHALIEEAVEIGRAVYASVEQSEFDVVGAERTVQWKTEGLNLFGKVDRVDEKNGFVRVVDYKTGKIDASPGAYYVGKKLQLQLYLKALSAGKTPAGAFYFPAASEYRREGQRNYQMTGFFNDAAMLLQDRTANPGESALFDTTQSARSGSRLSSELFSDFVDYSVLVAEQGVRELKCGYIGASPFGGCPSWCKYRGSCGSEGNARAIAAPSCTDIANIAHAAKEESDA